MFVFSLLGTRETKIKWNLGICEVFLDGVYPTFELKRSFFPVSISRKFCKVRLFLFAIQNLRAE